MRPQLLIVVLLTGALTGCASTPAIYQQEQFDATSAYSRAFIAPSSATCEAARRALLSQGYLISSAKPDSVEGRKNFQQDANTHIQISFNVVCMADSKGSGSIAFANALHDRYALKKSPTSASVGVGILGSLSLPIGSSDDALVKVGSETITARNFYDRFFGLVAHYLSAAPQPAPAESKPGG